MAISDSDALDAQTEQLVRLAADVAIGDEGSIRASLEACLRAEVSRVWIEELLLQTHLMCGFPRMLTGFAVYRQVFGAGEGGEKPSGPQDWGRWRERGVEVCHQVYTDHYEALRRNVHALHAAVEEWMIVDGYGKVLGRPGLDIGRRELCVIAQIAAARAPRQLRSHMRGALQVGVPEAQVNAALEIARSQMADGQWKDVSVLWGRVREINRG